MSFIQIGFLAALAALAVPIIVHLVFRQRAKRADLGTLRFLRIVLEHNARRRRVMRWLLLMLRLACVALLAFLFARPYLLAARSAGERRTVVVLVDRSASMELKQDGVRAIDRALAEVKQLLSQAPENSRFEIAWFDHAVEPLFAPAADGDKAKKPGREPARSEQLALLKAPEVCHGGTDYGAALEWARDVLAKAPPGPRVLHVFTDLQQSGLAWSEVDELPEDVASHLHDLGRTAVNNLAVTEARPERMWLRPDEQTSLHITVYNGGLHPVEELPILLSLTSGAKKVSLREQLKRVEDGTVESLRLDLPPLAEGLWQGTLSIEAEDDLPADNVRSVALLASKPYQVLLVDGRASPSPVLSSTYFLESALRLAPEGELYSASPYEPRQIAAGDPLPSLEKFDVVVLSDVGDLDRRDAEQLAGLVERGGGLLVFCGENVTAQRTAELAAAGLTVGNITGIQNSTDLPLRLGTWDAQHPIFAAFSDPQLGDLARLAFTACTKIAPANDAKVLASFKNGTPAVVEKRLGKGSVVWFTSTADRRWSDWTRSRLYLPLVYQLLGHQSGLTAGGRVREETLEAHTASALPGLTTGALTVHTTLPPGVHPQETHTLVVNTSPREAETDRTSIEEFTDRFGLKLAEEAAPVETAKPERQVAGTELIDNELWPWLAGLLLVALVAEGLVANRTSG
jgi:hypothetical protein